MNVLVTGAFGFVGSNLLKFLSSEKDISVFAVDAMEDSSLVYKKYFSWYQLDDVSWNKIDAVIHLAGKAHDTKDCRQEQEYFDINVGLTKTIFDYFTKSIAGKFIFLSSVKAVTKTIYGHSKFAAEQEILKRDLPPGKMVYILRPAMIHGPGNKGSLVQLFKYIEKGLPYPFGAFNIQRSLTSIGNVNFCVSEILEKNIEPGIYNLADDNYVSMTELIQMMARLSDRKARIWNMPKPIVKKGIQLGKFIGLRSKSEQIEKLTESLLVSNDNIKNALGISNMPVSALEGLKETILSFMKDVVSDEKAI